MAEKRPNTSELRALPEADLIAQMEALRRELWQYRVKAKEGAEQQLHRSPGIRRQIARIHTVMNEQRRQAQAPARRAS